MSGESERIYEEAQRRMALLPNYYAWIASHFSRHVRGKVLELGCGAGFVIRNYLARADSVLGVDLDAALLARLEAQHPGGKVRTARVDLLGDWHELGEFRADVIVALDVLEHFQDDGAFVEKLRRQLAPGGRVVLKVPAQSRLYGAIDEASGHFRRYDAQALAQLLESHGFRTLALRHMNAAGAWGYRLRRRRRTGFSLTFSPGKLRCVNALIPALALLDRIPGLKGLSLVGVFELQR